MQSPVKSVIKMRGLPSLHLPLSPSSPQRTISARRALSSVRAPPFRRETSWALKTGAAAAGACCIYAIDQSYSQERANITRTEGSFLQQPSFSLVQELAQEAKKSLIQRCMTKSCVPSSESHISYKGLDFSDISPQRAHRIIAALHSGKILDGETLMSLSNAAVQAFKSEPTVLDLRKAGDNITVVGDVHGSLPCLKKVMDLVGSLEDGGIMVVAGDYVDRGEHSLEVFCTFLLLKLAYPDNVYLLRGNHEDNEICAEYGFLDELQEKYGYETERGGIWEALSDVFASLPLAAKTETSLILHGGLPSADFQLADLEAIDAETRFSFKTLTEARTPVEKLIEGVLWSDPSSHDGISPNERGYGIEFGSDIAKDFLDRHGLKYLIRAHEHVEQGSQLLDCGEGKGVVTVFSTANYPFGEGTNAGAILKLDQKGDYDSISFTYSDATILDAFRYLDTDSNGMLARSEFLAGIEKLNQSLPEEKRLKNAEEVYNILDQQKQGQVDLDTFTQFFQRTI